MSEFRQGCLGYLYMLVEDKSVRRGMLYSSLAGIGLGSLSGLGVAGAIVHPQTQAEQLVSQEVIDDLVRACDGGAYSLEARKLVDLDKYYSSSFFFSPEDGFVFNEEQPILTGIDLHTKVDHNADGWLDEALVYRERNGVGELLVLDHTQYQQEWNAVLGKARTDIYHPFTKYELLCY